MPAPVANGGQVRFEAASGGVVAVVLSHPGKLNALSVAMWHQLRAGVEALAQAAQPPRVLLLRGEGGCFAAGGDIEEFPQFRFQAASLRAFHEDTVAPALRALLDCEIPLVAQIEGACVGGGLEVAACCDIRICGESSRFGVPIARLGFPLAPLEMQMLAARLGPSLLRELLLEARLLGADEAAARGLVSRVVADAEVPAQAQACAQRLAALSPQALRLNKRALRQLECGGFSPAQRAALYDYADSAEHREGLAAFLEKRPPKF